MLWMVTIVGSPIGTRYFYEWATSCIQLRSGSTLEFRGKTRTLYAFFFASVGISLIDRISDRLLEVTEEGDLVPALFGLILSVAAFYLYTVVQLNIFKWQCANTSSTSGATLECVAPQNGFFWRCVLLVLSVFTLIGWAWVAAGIARWLFSHVKSEGRLIRFRGTGGQILWRTIVAILACLPIVSIPWVIAWTYRWGVSQLEIEYAPSVANTPLLAR